MYINVTPDNSVALPDSPHDDKPKDAREAVEVSATTAMVLNELGLGFTMTPEDEAKAEKMFEDLRKSPAVKNFPQDINTPEIAARVGALLKTYDQNVVADAVQLRTVITNKLLLISDCGDPRFELKALEMLGKISDVGLFTEKSEVTIRHTTTESLENAIREKVRRLIHSNTVDVEPIVDDLEAELGLTNPEEAKESEEDYASTDDTGTDDTPSGSAQPT
jgi:predicted nucleic acid-binding protein